MDEWMTAEEREPVEVWGHRVLGEYGGEWVYEAACALDPEAVLDEDGSRPARRARQDRTRRWSDGLPGRPRLDQPFGEKAA